MQNTNLAWDEGKLAYHRNVSRDANPYPAGKASFYRWYAGWDEEHQANEMDLIKMAKADDLRKD